MEELNEGTPLTETKPHMGNTQENIINSTDTVTKSQRGT